jgi:hypothetical protein
MSKLVSRIGLATAVTVLTVGVLSAVAYVQPAAAAESPVVAAHGGGPGLRSEAALEAAAEALGMTADELSTQLWAGESLADLAEEAGVDLQVVQDAVTAANLEAQREAIAEAVADGTITQAHADWLLEGLDNGYWGAGSGFGFGPRGFGGRGRGPSLDTAPATTTPSSGA